MDVRTAIEQPRIGAQNRAEELERGTTAANLADALRAMGHTIKVGPMNAGVQAIAITPTGLQGWGDPHRDGTAKGS
jgi:gamma-glutamyltranspeptidase/glutathione hydrolase